MIRRLRTVRRCITTRQRVNGAYGFDLVIVENNRITILLLRAIFVNDTCSLLRTLLWNGHALINGATASSSLPHTDFRRESLLSHAALSPGSACPALSSGHKEFSRSPAVFHTAHHQEIFRGVPTPTWAAHVCKRSTITQLVRFRESCSTRLPFRVILLLPGVRLAFGTPCLRTGLEHGTSAPVRKQTSTRHRIHFRFSWESTITDQAEAEDRKMNKLTLC